MEFGHPKADVGLPVFNYALAFDTQNKEPLFYEKYPGSINDMTQLQVMLDKVARYGYKKIGFILDTGYFSRSNISAMDKHGYSFVIMVKGMNDLVSTVISCEKGTFENKWSKHIDDYDVYWSTVKRKLYEIDAKDRCFYLHYNDRIFQFPEDRVDVIEKENDLSGYFCIITSEKMAAKETIGLYKSREASEKLFRGDKSNLGDRSLQVYGDSSSDARIFIEFIALIIRNRIYNYLQDEMKALAKLPNIMTVPAAVRELEKIEMVRLTDNKYMLDHAVTATQKTILKAFGMDAGSVKYHAAEISRILRETSYEKSSID